MISGLKNQIELKNDLELNTQVSNENLEKKENTNPNNFNKFYEKIYKFFTMNDSLKSESQIKNILKINENDDFSLIKEEDISKSKSSDLGEDENEEEEFTEESDSRSEYNNGNFLDKIRENIANFNSDVLGKHKNTTKRWWTSEEVYFNFKFLIY